LGYTQVIKVVRMNKSEELKNILMKFVIFVIYFLNIGLITPVIL